MDNYVEHLVKRKDPAYFALLKILCVLLDILALFLALNTLVGILLLILAAVLTYFVWQYASVEYEYLYMGGNLTVDEVFNKSRRKTLMETNREELVLIAPKSSTSARDELRGDCKIMDISGAGAENLKYAYIFSRNGQKHCFYIEMTEQLLREMRYHSPSKVKMQ